MKMPLLVYFEYEDHEHENEKCAFLSYSAYLFIILMLKLQDHKRRTSKGIVEVPTQEVKPNTNPSGSQCEGKHSSKPQPCLSFILRPPVGGSNFPKPCS